VDAAKWDSSLQKVKRNTFNKSGDSATEINARLLELQSKVMDIYRERKVLRQPVTAEYLRDELRTRLGESTIRTDTFFSVFDKFIAAEKVEHSWTTGTIKAVNTVYNQLKQFQPKIDFDSIDNSFLNRYLLFQRDVLGHRNTTIAKNFKLLKWFMNWATKKGYNTNMSFKDFDPELKGTTRNQNIIFLTWDEFTHLYNLEIPKQYLAQVRDVFCFCCVTGLRYSDVSNLKRSNIKSDAIEFTTIKTEDTLRIQLNQYSRTILAKYAAIPFKDDKCLPVISNQKMNEYLKELGKFAHIDQPETIVYYKGAERIEKTYQKWELLSTHTGRKTFVTNALSFGIPAEVVMSWTGHKDHKVMENYFKVIEKQQVSEMGKFDLKQNDEKQVSDDVDDLIDEICK
jgi:integrase